MTAFDKQFWRYSSKNIVGQTQHPRTKYIRNLVLDLWAGLNTLQEIGSKLNLSQDTVHSYIKRARAKGDPRAVKRTNHWRRRKAKADQRRDQISLMSHAGMKPMHIAKALGISERLVFMRIKDAATND